MSCQKLPSLIIFSRVNSVRMYLLDGVVAVCEDTAEQDTVYHECHQDSSVGSEHMNHPSVSLLPARLISLGVVPFINICFYICVDHMHMLFQGMLLVKTMKYPSPTT